jgi:hypothetical protein
MSGVAFDTLRLATALRDRAKLSQEQAEGFASAMAEALQGGLVTKSDLDAAEDRLDRRIDATEDRLKLHVDRVSSDLQRQIEANKADVLKWMFGTVGFQTLVLLGATAGLLKLAHP